MDYPKRKLPRLRGFDYTSANYFFVTICTKDKKCLFGKPNQLNCLGKLVEMELLSIPNHYTNVKLDQYVVMPNHVHAVIILEATPTDSVSLSTVVGQFKSGVTRKARTNYPDLFLWQSSFYDSVIRNQQMYLSIWNYIDGNPAKWQEDELFVPHP